MFKVMFHMIAQKTREDNVKPTAVKPQQWLISVLIRIGSPYWNYGGHV